MVNIITTSDFSAIHIVKHTMMCGLLLEMQCTKKLEIMIIQF